MYAKIERDTYRLIDDYEKGRHSVYTNSYSFTTSQLFPDVACGAKEKCSIVDTIKQVPNAIYHKKFKKIEKTMIADLREYINSEGHLARAKGEDRLVFFVACVRTVGVLTGPQNDVSTGIIGTIGQA